MTAEFRFAGDATDAQVTRSLELNGIAVLDGFLDADRAAKLGREVTSMFDRADTGDLSFGESSVKRLYPESFPAAFASRPVLRTLSTAPLARTACDDFFGAAKWEHNAIFAMRYRDKMPVNEKFHIDPSATVKFFYYLSDVGPENGPFTFCVGSHREGFYRMRAAALAGVPGAKVIPDAETRNVTPIEGKAGTLIVFNSIGIHRAGEIKAGSGRLTVTFHYAARYERSLRKRLVRKIRGTSNLEYLCAYAPKHQSLSTPYEE